MAAQTFLGTFLIHPDSENGLERNSVALVFQLRAIDKKKLKNKVGRLNSSYLSELQKHIESLLQMKNT